jgi:hypothetical protein
VGSGQAEWRKRWKEPNKFAVVEDISNHDQHSKIQDTKILSTKPRYKNQLIRKASNIKFHPNSMNREAGLIGHGNICEL